jgi:hypothetical protein
LSLKALIKMHSKSVAKKWKISFFFPFLIFDEVRWQSNDTREFISSGWEKLITAEWLVQSTGKVYNLQFSFFFYATE